MTSLVLSRKGREVAREVADRMQGGEATRSDEALRVSRVAAMLEAALLEEREKTAGFKPEQALQRAARQVETELELAGTDRTPQEGNLVQEALLSGAGLRPDGTREWRNQGGERHRDGDQPAIIEADGTQEWYQHGKCHRDGDQPAVIWADGTQIWYQHGERHRDGDQPAVIWADGTQKWFQGGRCHRDGDQPAYVRADGTQEWFHHGELHRDGGPAVIRADGTQEWYQHGWLHRDGGPAMVAADGTRIWV